MSKSRYFLQRFALGFWMLAAFAVGGCDDVDRRPIASGTEGTITVVTDSATWAGPVGDAIRAELGRDVETYPVPEPEFDFDQVDLTSNDFFERVIKKRKYLLFAGALDGESTVSQFIRGGLDSATTVSLLEGGSGIFQHPDAWYRRQIVVYATAPSPEALVDQIHENGDNLRFVFNRATRERLTERMFKRMRQRDIEEDIAKKHDFAISVQHDYFVAQDTLNFVRLRRVLSDTWREVFVTYIEDGNPSLISPDWIVATRDSLTELYVRGTFDDSYVEVDQRRPLTIENTDFLGRYAYEMRGLWRMTGDAMGGPLLNYTFYDEDQRRIYMIDGMVFAPTFDKREFLRQIEAIAYTFRTGGGELASAGTRTTRAAAG
jgi:hypothetical protein